MRIKFSYFLFLIFLSFFVLLPENTVHAQNIEYQGWIYNTKYIIINDVTYKVLITEGGQSILLISDKGSTSLDLNSCDETTNTRYCFNYTAFDKDEQDYKAFLYVYSIQPLITLTRTVTDNILEVGDTSEFKATISNRGDYDATDVNFIEEFPENIEIESVKEGTITNNSVTWKGDIKKAESVEITYKIKSIGEADKYQKAYVNYFDGISNKEVVSSSIRLYSPKTLYIEMTTDKEDYELSEKIDLNIKLSNEGKDDIKVNSLIINIPDSMQIEEYDSEVLSKKSENTFFYEHTLTENESAEIKLEFSGKKVGMFFVIVSGDYNYRGHNYKIQNEKIGYLVHNQGIEISTSIDPVEYVSSNQMLVVFTKVKNKNSFTKIRNIQMITTSDISNFNKGSFSAIDINQTLILLNTEIKIPDETSEKRYPVTFNVTYTIDNGEEFSELLERTIVVRPLEQKQIQILPTISSYNVLEDESITVSVSLNNPKDSALKEVFINVNIPKGFQVNGPTSAYSSLPASTESKIISFVLTPSRVEKPTAYDLNFSAQYVDGGKKFSISEQKSITVSPRVPKIGLVRAVEQTDVIKGELLDVSYTITNDDVFPVHDLVLIIPEKKEYDTLNTFEKNIEKISQSESLTFKGEQLRAKKTGNFELGSAILFFKDIYERQFNISSNLIFMSVKEAELYGPAINIEQAVQKNIVAANESIELTINISNVGKERAIGNVSEDNTEMILPFYSNKIIKRNIRFEKEGAYTLPRAVFYYYYGNNKARAYSDEIEIKVINSTTSAIETLTPKENIPKQSDVSDNSQAANTKQKESIFRKFYNWLKNLFIRTY